MAESKLTPRDRAFAWMDGWKTGAAFAPVPDKYLPECDPETADLFSRGWKAGREASKAAQVECARVTGYTFQTVTLAEVVRGATGELPG